MALLPGLRWADLEDVDEARRILGSPRRAAALLALVFEREELDEVMALLLEEQARRERRASHELRDL
jgi:hypothetical protein